MSNSFRLTLAQLNPTVGDLGGNAAKAVSAWDQAKAAGSGLVALPEMFITGYQTQDLVARPGFFGAAMAKITELASACRDGPALAIGGLYAEGGQLYNAYYVLQDGQVAARILKHHLPNETVFDEKRLFAPGPVAGPYRIGPIRIGSCVCEDAWHTDVVEAQAESGAEIFLIPNGSPYFRNKQDIRIGQMVARVIENDLPLIYLNMIGGQDDQVFDGATFALNRGGRLALQLPQFDEAIAHLDLTETQSGWQIEPGKMADLPDEWEADYHAMVLGLRDYMAKTGFKRVILGLSGGIDSALVAVIAADALGPENLRCVMLPSEYTSEHSLADAQSMAQALGCRYDHVPISASRQAVTETLAPLFAGHKQDVTEENIQARLRGLLLMAMSNKFGEMLLTTGNKSELAVGYATIYGDMAGGYNPIKDLYKTRLARTCLWRNANNAPWMKGPKGEMIPERIITKPPSAELRPDQKDQDSLPPYELLDQILDGLIDREASVAELVEEGFDGAMVRQVEKMIFVSEYKRFQSAPGVRLTPRSFGLDRRYPIVNAWRDES